MDQLVNLSERYQREAATRRGVHRVGSLKCLGPGAPEKLETSELIPAGKTPLATILGEVIAVLWILMPSYLWDFEPSFWAQ